MTKSPLEKEIDRPLGLEAKPRGTRVRSGMRVGAGQLVLGLAAVCLVAVSTAISFSERPYRTPQQVVLSTPDAVEEAASPPARSTEAYPTADGSAGGPSIIRVDPPAQGAEGGNVIVVRDPSAVGQDLRVAHLPDRALIEETDAGPLPKRGADGRRPFDAGG